jgi:starch synthase (maltosyl-transferring)
MGFDWVYINPIAYAGFSGSIYAVKDYFRLNPLVRGDASCSDDELVEGFVREANGQGIDVMTDLVVNHTSRDAPLVAEHPRWYERDADGAIRSPSTADPQDSNNVTVWGDLAAIDWSERPERAEIVAYFSGVVRYHARLGMRGFRCDAAYKVPAEVWQALRSGALAVRDDAIFVGETLGCTPDEVEGLGDAGFDYIFDSSKWWDFRAGWLLEQYERYRHIAPSIAFPESHDTPRLAAEFPGRSHEQIAAEYRLRYLFAAFFSGGVMMPIGYEFGFERRLDVVHSRAADWEPARFDLTAFIAAANAMKAAIPALNDAGPQRRLTDPTDPAVVLLRESEDGEGYAIGLINPDAAVAAVVDTAAIRRAVEARAEPRDLTPLLEPVDLAAAASLTLRPLEMRVFGPVQGQSAAKPQSLA